jgi:hypothetical protein
MTTLDKPMILLSFIKDSTLRASSKPSATICTLSLGAFQTKTVFVATKVNHSQIGNTWVLPNTVVSYPNHLPNTVVPQPIFKSQVHFLLIPTYIFMLVGMRVWFSDWKLWYSYTFFSFFTWFFIFSNFLNYFYLISRTKNLTIPSFRSETKM